MKKSHVPVLTGFILCTVLAIVTSCKKENTTPASLNSITAAIAGVQGIAVGSTSATSTSPADSVYVINGCPRNYQKDSVAASSLPETINNYLSINYTGYTFQKAFTIKDAAGSLQGYVVIIQFNGKPVGLSFDSSGNFVKVLEQREGRDLVGQGWHEGGRFRHRDGLKGDTVALDALPAEIRSYFAANYPQDTLSAAFKNIDSSFVVLSRNNGLFATTFNSNGTFIKRLPLPAHEGKGVSISQSALLPVITSYLSATYPNYVFEKAFSFMLNGTPKGYVVMIDANNTKYAVEFDASGNFVKGKTIH